MLRREVPLLAMDPSQDESRLKGGQERSKPMTKQFETTGKVVVVVVDFLLQRFNTQVRILYCKSELQEIAKLMNQFTHSKLPLNFEHYFAYSSDVSSYSTRHSSSNDIFLTRFMSSKTQHSIKYIGAKIWDNIPFDLKNAPYSKFKESYKKFLLCKYKS